MSKLSKLSKPSRPSKSRRWRSGPLAPAPGSRIRQLSLEEMETARRLVRHLTQEEGRTLRWSTLARYAGRGQDRLDVERTVELLVEAGLLQVKERRDRRGDFEPYLVRLSPGREAAAADAVGFTPEPSLAELHAERARCLVQTLRSLVQQDGALPVPARALVQQALGNTKLVQVADFRAEIEAAFDLPLETLVRDHTAAVLTAGAVRYRFRGRPMDARSSAPWLAILEPVLRELTDLELDAQEVITLENLTPFETLSYEGLADHGAVLVFTSGFMGRAERSWIERLAGHPSIRRFRHWGDIDPGGLLIFRSLYRLVKNIAPEMEVRPWRMDPELLRHPQAVPLTPRDRSRLESYLADSDNPLLPLARAMLDEDRKLEQEVLLLDRP